MKRIFCRCKASFPKTANHRDENYEQGSKVHVKIIYEDGTVDDL